MMMRVNHCSDRSKVAIRKGQQPTPSGRQVNRHKVGSSAIADCDDFMKVLSVQLAGMSASNFSEPS